MSWRWGDINQSYWLLSLIVMLMVYLGSKRYVNRELQKYISPEGIIRLYKNISLKKRGIKNLAYFLALAFMILALMRLQSPGGKTQITSEGIEVMILADVSDSMLVEDLRPNRLGQMKYDLLRFIDLLGGHQAGLVAFAGSAHLLSPLTNDPSALKMYIDSLDVTSVSSQGTDIGNAIEVAIESFDRGGKKDSPNSVVTRAILIVSDGENHEPETIEAVKKIVTEKGIRVFTLAYGTQKGGGIPQRDTLGYLKGYKKNDQGQEIVSQVGGEFLKELSKYGGGQFYFAEAGKDHMKKIISSFDELQKKVSSSEVGMSYNEHYGVFAFLALFFGLISLFLPETKSQPTKWLGRFFAFLIITFSLNSHAEFNSLKSWYHYRQALEALKTQKTDQAYSHLREVLKSEPESNEAVIALGVVFAQLKDNQKSSESFKSVDQTAKGFEEQFLARFNEGVLWQAMSDTDRALAAYHKALEIKPDSRETKINIELLIQQQQEKDKSSQGEGGDQNDQKDKENKDPQKDPQKYEQPKPQPKKFKSQDLSESDMKKILSELKNQEQKIRSEFNKKESKERPNKNDW